MNSFGGLWDDKMCFDYEQNNGITLNNESFVNMYINTADKINSLVPFKTFADIGGGVGAYSWAMKLLKKEVFYYDLNKYHFDYAQLHQVASYYKQCDITKTKIKADLVACIEVMEHITDNKLNEMLSNIECNYFHFSSTPYTSKFDMEWGHINIKQESEWIALFEQHGYKLLTKVNVPTEWSLIFEKIVKL